MQGLSKAVEDNLSDGNLGARFKSLLSAISGADRERRLSDRWLNIPCFYVLC